MITFQGARGSTIVNQKSETHKKKNEGIRIESNWNWDMWKRRNDLWEKEGTCLTDSAISGPMPSPGKRVARIGVEAAEEKALGFARKRLPKVRLRSWEAMLFHHAHFLTHNATQRVTKNLKLIFETRLERNVLSREYSETKGLILDSNRKQISDCSVKSPVEESSQG